MRAAVYHGQRDVRIEEVEEPRAGPGDVVIKVAYNGICGTDLYEYYSGPMGIPTEPHPLTGACLPQILGHEFGGWVDSVGEDVDDLEVGTLVAVNPIYGCGQCAPCLRHESNLCVVAAFHGLMSHGGGLSERTVVHRSMVHPLPSTLGPVHAALVEPMAVSYRAVRRADISAGEQVLILGAGPIGLGAFFTARWLGIEPIVSEPSESRRQVLAGLGAKTILDPSRDDIVSAVLDLTDGVGVGATIDAAAHPSTFKAALGATAKGGNVVLVGIPHEPLSLDPIALFVSEITLRASNAYADDFQATIDAMGAGAFPIGDWVSRIPLDSLVEEGFEVLRSGAAMKILVDMTGERSS